MSKWKQELTKHDEEKIQKILYIMDIDLYRINELIPMRPMITSFKELKSEEISLMNELNY